MGLFGLFKPAWMSNNSEKAVNAVKKVSDQAKLYEIAKNAPVYIVRKEATQKLTSQTDLLDIAKNGLGSDVRCCAIKKLTDQAALAEIATNQKDNDSIARACAISMLTDETQLSFIAMNDQQQHACIKALEKITNQGLIAEIASNPFSLAHKAALLELTDPALLQQTYVNIAKNTSHNSAHNPKDLLAMIEDDAALADIARYARSHHISKEAVLKISDQRLLADLAMAQIEHLSIEAICRLSSQDVLAEVIRKSQKEYKIVDVAIEKLTDESLMDDLIQDQELRANYRIYIAVKIADQSRVQDIYTSIGSDTHEPGWIRLRAAKEIQDAALAQSICCDIAHNGEDWIIRHRAISEISDESILADIAKSSCNSFKYSRSIEFHNISHAIATECDMREEVVSRLKNRDVLSDIAKNAANKEVRARALKRLNEI